MKIKENTIIFETSRAISNIEITIGVDTYETAYEKLKDLLVGFIAPHKTLTTKHTGVLIIADNFYGIDYADILLYFNNNDILQSVVVQPHWSFMAEFNIEPDLYLVVKNKCDKSLNENFKLDSDSSTVKIYLSDKLVISTVESILTDNSKNFCVNITKDSKED